MKQIRAIQLLPFGLSVLCACAISLNSQSSLAQSLQTSGTNQTKVYGDWSQPPATPRGNPVDTGATRSRFRNLFPENGPQPASNRPSPPTRMSRLPAPAVTEPIRARPLQPSAGNQFLPGSFVHETNSDGPLANVNHYEASTAEAAMPLPQKPAPWQPLAGQPEQDKLTSGTWPGAASETVSEASSLSGVVGSVQAGLKDAMDGFESEGGWGERVAGLFGGGENQFRKVFGSLALVVGGYLAFVFLARKFLGGASRGVPSEVIEVIGNAPFGPRKNLQLVRLGSKLLLLMNGPEGTHPVGEITDAEEVDYLISLCKGRRTQATRSVMNAVRKFGSRSSGSANETPQSVRRVRSQGSNPNFADPKFTTSQLVQALQTIQGNSASGTVYEA